MAKSKESLGGRAARTLSAMLVGNVAGLVLGAITIFLVARLLGPSNYGAYTIAVSYYLLVDAALYFGVGQYLYKRLPEFHSKGKKREAFNALNAGFLLAIIFGTVFTLIGMLAALFVAGVYAASGVSALTLMIASLVVFFSILFGAANNALVGFGEMKLAVFGGVTENAAQLAASVLLIMMGFGFNGAVAGIVIGYLVGFAASLAALLVVMRKYVKRGPFDWREAKYAFRFCTPIAVSNAVNNGTTVFATLLLGVFVASSLLGNYGLASRGINIAVVVYGTPTVAAIPVLSIALSRRSRKSLEKTYNKSITYSLLVMLPLIAFIAVFSKQLTYLLATRQYVLAPIYLSLMAIGTMIYVPGLLASNLLVSGGETRKLLKYIVIANAVQFLLILLLVPAFKALGAIAAVFVLGNALTTILIMRGAGRHFRVRTDYRKIVRTFASSAALIIALSLIYLIPGNALPLLLGFVAMLALYPIFAVLLGAIGKEDVKEIKKSVDEIPALRKSAGFMIDYISFLTGRR